MVVGQLSLKVRRVKGLIVFCIVTLSRVLRDEFAWGLVVFRVIRPFIDDRAMRIQVEAKKLIFEP